MQIEKDQARQTIQSLIAEYRRLRREEKVYFERMSETDVVNKFVTPLFAALGWPTRGSEYQQEVHTAVGRPDIRAEYAPNEYIYVEAKRFGVIGELSRTTLSGVLTPGQMMLPGMATDRTKEEQQAINYAFANNGSWAILTNFERFRLFNARRDWLVFSVENPDGYLEADFDYLWQLAWHNIQNGSLERLSSQRARADVDNDYLNFINEWRLRLARDILQRPLINQWAYDDEGHVNLPRLRGVVQRLLDRLVVVRYAEDHLIAPAGTLWNLLELSRTNPYALAFNEQLRHLYRNFDRLHNSALFALDVADQASLSDGVLQGLIEKLYEARFRAMTPDIMGNTYEQYLGKALAFDGGTVDTRDNLETRKKQGSYYTPQVIVRYMVDNSLGRYLYGTQNGRPDGDPLPDATRKRWDEIQELRLIDPACGSGSFLIYAYEVLADFYRGEMQRLERERQARLDELVAAGMTAPIELQIQLAPYTGALQRLANYPHLILERHIYGLDLDPQAAEIATVNLMMRAMADQRGREQRLPLILNQNVKVGNGLIGAGPADPRYDEMAAELAELRRLRLELVGQPHGHEALLAQVAELTQRLDGRLNAPLAAAFAETVADWEEQIRPFHWAVGFPELFVDENGRGLGAAAGFTIVVGNPPWEIVKPDLREYYAQFDPEIESKLTRQKAEARIKQLNAFDPRLEAGWAEQQARIGATASYFQASPDYTRQGRGDTATHKLFVERVYTLLSETGRLGYVVPSGIYSDLGTKELREMLISEGNIEYLYSFSNEKWFFNSVHHAFHFTLLGAQKGIYKESFLATFRFNPRVAVAPSELNAFLENEDNLVIVKHESLLRFSPTSLSIMEFHSQTDYALVEKIYADWPLLGENVDNIWNPQFRAEFHMTNARGLFNQVSGGLPLYEGKMIHQFVCDFAMPRYWINENLGRQAILGKTDDEGQVLAYQRYRLGFRDVASSTNERTLIAAILPKDSFAGNTITLEQLLDNKNQLFLLALLNSFLVDYIVRYKVGTHVSIFYAYQLPVPRLMSGNKFFDAIVPRAAALTCTTPAFAALWEAVMPTPWQIDDRPQTTDHRQPPVVGHPSSVVRPPSSVVRPPSSLLPTTDPAQRQQLRDELDAIIAHLYGLSRDDFAHILTTFPLVFPDTPEGEAKKAGLLAVYDWVGEEWG
ncbi:MAG: N-6 DNA methylase [Chloroflexota bacterium]